MVAPTLHECLVDALQSGEKPRIVTTPWRRRDTAMPAVLTELLMSATQARSILVLTTGPRTARTLVERVRELVFEHSDFQPAHLIQSRADQLKFTNPHGHEVELRAPSGAIRGASPTDIVVLSASLIGNLASLFHDVIIPCASINGVKLSLFESPYLDRHPFMEELQAMINVDDGEPLFECLEFLE